MLFPKKTVPREAERPSTFREDPSQRTNMYPGPDEDYATEVDESPEPYGLSTDVEPPIPVYVVGSLPGDRTYRDWSSGRFTVGAKVAQIASYDRRRLRLRVRNLDADTSIVVLRNATDSLHTGYEIPFGEAEEFLHNGGVWVRSADATDVAIAVYSEFEIDEFHDDDKGK